MTWATWWLFLVTEFVLCLTPGPAVCLVLAKALSLGPRRSIASSLGILAANVTYFVLSATSLGAILVASSRLFFAIKWIGAAYLIYLGLRTLFGEAPVVAAAPEAASHAGNWRLFGDGFILQASNPKALVFFTALLPQFVNPGAPVALQIAILGVTSLVVEFFVLLGYGGLAGHASLYARQPQYASWTNRVAGLLLIGAGAGLATLRRG